MQLINRTCLRRVALLLITAALVWTCADAEKFTSCCTAVSDEEVTEPIIGFRIQRRSEHCVNAVILTTDKNVDMCCPVKSLWLDRKIKEFMRNLRRTRASPASTPLAHHNTSVTVTPSPALPTEPTHTEGSGQ